MLFKRLLSVCFVFSIVFSMTACFYDTKRNTLEMQYLSLAQQYMDSGDFEKAASVLEEGIQILSDSSALQPMLDTLTATNTQTQPETGAEISDFSVIGTESLSEITSATMHFADPDNIIYPTGSSASACQPAGSYNRTYDSSKAFDRNYDTCWMVSGKQGAVGNWIELYFKTPKQISGIQFLNGNCWNGYYQGEKVAKGVYTANGRVQDFTLTFSDGTSQSFTAKDVREETYGENRFYFDSTVTTSSIRLTINSAYTGSKWDTVCCISEIAAFY
ncbi:MAG: NADase-type glycan-binding domain-containing protein [Acutalibacteraceae bacterium]